MTALKPVEELVAAGLSPLVGRERELVALGAALDEERLTTVAGPGGVGKTRLALACLERREGPTTAVSLASVRHPEQVLAALLGALDVRSEQHVPPVRALQARLGREPTLLLLDNCEHVRDAVADLSAELLISCPRLHVLATSREPLGVPGEAVFTLTPLSAEDAVALFVDRARRAVRAFSPTAGEREEIATLCSALDGLPLAIELAAARARLVGLGELGDPARRLDMLAQGREDVPRHRSLRSCIDWSVERLDAPARALLARLSVFAGGWTLAAAEAVCSGGELPRSDVLDALGRLADRSLIGVEHGGSAHSRLGMLATVREYAAEQLGAQAGACDWHAGHAAWCVELAEAGEAQLRSGDRVQALDRLDRESGNLRAALSWARQHDPPLGLRIATALAPYWVGRGRLEEGRLALAALRAASDVRDPVLRVRSDIAYGLLLVELGDGEQAASVVAGAVRQGRAVDEAMLLGRALNLQGQLDLMVEPARAAESLREAIALAQSEGDAWCLADSLGKLGASLLYRGEAIAAREPLSRALVLAREGGDASMLHRALGGLARVALFEGRAREGIALLEESLAVSRRLRDRNWIAIDLAMLGELQRAAGRLEPARQAIEAGLALAQEVGTPYPTYLATGLLGRLALSEGRLRDAAILLEEARLRGERDGLRAFAPWWPLGLAEVALAEDRPEQAREHFRAALAAAQSLGNGREAAQATAGLGRAALALGEAEIAVAQIMSALEVQRELQDPDGQRATLAALTPALRAVGQAERAMRLQEAGSVPEAVALALRGRGARSGETTPGWGGLTRAEEEVARLAAEGASNPQIAARLFMSRSTVKTHLARVYAKLGVANRTELAAVVARPADGVHNS